jgi:ElaB/YqjD/DUF883 family membrane-anchored ribosome-binding protein
VGCKKTIVAAQVHKSEKALGDATVHRSFFGVPHHRHIHACTSKVDLSIGSIHSKAFMSDQKTAHEKISALGASISSNVNEALQSAQPAMNRMSQRVKDELHDLEESGKDAYSDAKHKLEKEAHHVRVTTEHLIQHSPFNAVLIAAGTGAVAALAVSWFLRSRQH